MCPVMCHLITIFNVIFNVSIKVGSLHLVAQNLLFNVSCNVSFNYYI
jgi:hypothetical protein